jgi:hypothetical protein
MMNGGFPGLAKLVAIFVVEVVKVFFDFQGFVNESGGVIWGRH